MIDGFAPGTPGPVEIPPVMPVLPLRDLVLFPFIITPLSVSRAASIQAVEFALNHQQPHLVLLLAQKSPDTDNPRWGELYRVGTAATVMRTLRLPDGRVRILVQGVARVRVEYPTEETGFLQARVEVLREGGTPETIEAAALVRSVRSGLERLAALGKSFSSEVMVVAQNLDHPGRLADLAASNLELKVADAQRILEIDDPADRLREVLAALNREAELLEMQQHIATEARSEIDRGQREYYLRQQLRAIEKELGEGLEAGEEVRELRGRVESSRMPEPARRETLKQIERLRRMPPDGAEGATLRGYLEWVTTMPWGRHSRRRIDLEQAQKVLEAEHHGLEPVKERILEFLAVRKLKPRARGPILCFAGPPGVGKTSLGQAIARALDRKFVRVSLGGVRDEAEIRGHRRTYVGAMPGRVIQGIHQAGRADPVFLIDEIDKIGADFRGDPAAALLEVLDPEQNRAFRDHYLNLPFDLSRVLFIATANLVDPIETAVRDRLEVIRIAGYTEEEKVEIARRHLLPRQLEAHGLEPNSLQVADDALISLIRDYTREAGLRNLEREIAALCRKVAREVAEGRTPTRRVRGRDLPLRLGPPRIAPGPVLDSDPVGAAIGLAWTAAGGEVLRVEALVMAGKGELILTGQLGPVMQESARAALSWLRSCAREIGVEPRMFSRRDVHIHVPEGAIAKDGPSAGVALVAALCSALGGRPVRRTLAMTGEITLRGDVLAVGGIREKVLAARRAGLKGVILPQANEKDLADVPAPLRRDLRLHLVKDVREVLRLVLR